MIDEYKDAGIEAEDVRAQSFNLNDVLYWLYNEPEIGEQAAYLDGHYNLTRNRHLLRQLHGSRLTSGFEQAL